MQVISPQLIKNKKVLLRYDLDVPIVDDFRLKAGLSTLKLCLENAAQVILMGHIGRPSFKFFVPKYSVAPIVEWFKNQGYSGDLGIGKLKILENLRFDPREESLDEGYAKELALMGDVYINEAFAAYHLAVSTTILPKLLPHGAGLRFAAEVEKLTQVREHPKKPFIAIMGGVKVEDKLPVVKVLAKNADAVLVGGKLVHEIRDQSVSLPNNVMVGKLSDDGFDISPDTTDSWRNLILNAATIVWNGPLGRFEDPKYNQTQKVAEMVLNSGAEVVIGGGDSVAALSQYGLLEEAQKKTFVSVGGGAMLKLISDGTLPTIEALL